MDCQIIWLIIDIFFCYYASFYFVYSINDIKLTEIKL